MFVFSFQNNAVKEEEAHFGAGSFPNIFFVCTSTFLCGVLLKQNLKREVCSKDFQLYSKELRHFSMAYQGFHTEVDNINNENEASPNEKRTTQSSNLSL